MSSGPVESASSAVESHGEAVIRTGRRFTRSRSCFSERIDGVEESICTPEKSTDAVEKSIYTPEERTDRLAEPADTGEEPIYTVAERAGTPEKWIVGLEKSSVAVEEAADGLGF